MQIKGIINKKNHLKNRRNDHKSTYLAEKIKGQFETNQNVIKTKNDKTIKS